MIDMLDAQNVPFASAFDFYFMQHGHDITANAEVFPGAHAAIRDLQFLGHHVIIATDQPTVETRLGTLKWLYDHAITPDELLFTSDKTDVDADWYIDDRQEHLLALVNSPSLPWYVNIVGIDRPWNKLEEIEGILAVNDVTEYVELIERLGYNDSI